MSVLLHTNEEDVHVDKKFPLKTLTQLGEWFELYNAYHCSWLVIDRAVLRRFVVGDLS